MLSENNIEQYLLCIVGDIAKINEETDKTVLEVCKTYFNINLIKIGGRGKL